LQLIHKKLATICINPVALRRRRAQVSFLAVRSAVTRCTVADATYRQVGEVSSANSSCLELVADAQDLMLLVFAKQLQ